MHSGDAELVAEGLSKRFGDHVAVSNVSLTVTTGSVLCVLGKNGAGKSTLIRMCVGLLRPDEGRVSLDGRDIAGYGSRLYSRMSAVLEDSSNFYMYLSGRENLYYQGALYGLGRREVDNRTGTYVEVLDLARHMGKRVGDYSRGMQQKLAVVVGLLPGPDILFLDEPTLGLDVTAKAEVVGFIKELVSRGRTGVVLTSHQSDVVAGLADSVLLIDEGSVKFAGGEREFRSTFAADVARISFEGPAEVVERAVAEIRRAGGLTEARTEDARGVRTVARLSTVGTGARRLLMALAARGDIRILEYSTEDSDLDAVLLQAFSSGGERDVHLKSGDGR
jgi:ABC-2 type transport system ATP-binding protein